MPSACWPGTVRRSGLKGPDEIVSQAVLQAPMPPPFDPNFALGAIIPLLGAVVFAVCGALVLRWLFRSPIAEAIAEGIRLRRRRKWGAAEGTRETQVEGARLTAVEERLAGLQGQISELAERLDFAERLLAERRERKLGAGQ